MPDQTERREPLDLEAVRRRFERFRQYEDAAGGPLTGAEQVTAIAAAWDVEPLLAEVDRLRLLVGVEFVREYGNGYRDSAAYVEGYLLNPSPAELVDALRRVHKGLMDQATALFREADRAAAGGGAGNPAMEDQPPPTPTETGADRG